MHSSLPLSLEAKTEPVREYPRAFPIARARMRRLGLIANGPNLPQRALGTRLVTKGAIEDWRKLATKNFSDPAAQAKAMAEIADARAKLAGARFDPDIQTGIIDRLLSALEKDPMKKGEVRDPFRKFSAALDRQRTIEKLNRAAKTPEQKSAVAALAHVNEKYARRLGLAEYSPATVDRFEKEGRAVSPKGTLKERSGHGMALAGVILFGGMTLFQGIVATFSHGKTWFPTAFFAGLTALFGASAFGGFKGKGKKKLEKLSFLGNPDHPYNTLQIAGRPEFRSPVRAIAGPKGETAAAAIASYASHGADIPKDESLTIARSLGTPKSSVDAFARLIRERPKDFLAVRETLEGLDDDGRDVVDLALATGAGPQALGQFKATT